MFDGKPNGFSRQLFQRNARTWNGLVEQSWLDASSDSDCEYDSDPSSSFMITQHSSISFGNRINHPMSTLTNSKSSSSNEPPDVGASVRFQVVVLDESFPVHLLKYIPSLNAAGLPGSPRVVVAVVACEDMTAGEDGDTEIYIDYGRDPLTLGLKHL
mmetsp:Transcript_6912/g.9357  ORF Transcript_6912/g.9357 Transcript_6912/m.9357 type:complete len:157 (+) Transcript_6912:123-593(+)|eukprot:CAMPEP_0196574942 /NCGR_PEP_ID=MMETSP1081-20130531/4539_1 /TAXON_ID=36882 /ORGANISM="Pyramimonas amylifera, Strain CCMP720" /LENGTH=156 /DNA_ID=CAMNT_0041893097 /DNA_START=56 /DNA_END=526 /DNA_ORIENTATION=-